MFPYGGYGNSFFNPLSMTGKLAIIGGVCMFLAIIAGFMLFFWFLSKKNEKKFTGFLGWVYEFLDFKKMLAESILRVTYLIFASYVTLFSFGYLLFTEGGSIGGRLLTFLMFLVFGNAVVRVAYEFMLIALIICRNTTEINNKIGNAGFFAPVAPQAEPVAANVPFVAPTAPAAQPVAPVAPAVQPVAPATPAAQPVAPVAPAVQPVAPAAPAVQPVAAVDPVPQVAFCYDCGKQIRANVAHCPHCGAAQQ